MSLSYSIVAKKSAEIQAKLKYAIDIGRVRTVRVREGNRPKCENMMLSRPGPLPLPTHQQRSYTVSVRFNGYELAELDKQRNTDGGRCFPRGKWLRMSWQRIKPEATVPKSNRLAYISTARSAANLTQISALVDLLEVRQQTEETGRELAKFRASLLRSAFHEATDIEIVVAGEDRRARRGPFPLPSEDVRDHIVCVRVNAEERFRLDSERGDAMMGEWLRMVWQDLQSEEKILAVSQHAYNLLACSAKSLNTVAHHLNQISHFRNHCAEIQSQTETLEKELKAFRISVKRAKESMQ